MSPRNTETDDSTPEDVAALYAWANLTGARYRDFSAVRREQRARLRLRAAKHSLEQELEAHAKANAEGAKVAGERVAEARRSEAAALAALRAIEEEREIAEAQESARRKQLAFEEAEQRRRERTGPQPGMLEGDPGLAKLSAPRASIAAEFTQPEALAAEAAGVAPKAPELSPVTAIRPAWLEAAADLPLPEEPQIVVPPIRATMHRPRTGSVAATLLDSRAEVASRWPVLQALIGAAAESSAAKVRMSWPRGPVVAIVSPAGGTGKTSLAASLTRTLAIQGERVLLVEAAADGLLPLYFGIDRLAPGSMRTVARRERDVGEISLLALDLAGARVENRAREHVIETLLARAQGSDRVILDLPLDAAWIVERLAILRPMVLAAMAPDMNSVAGMRAMEQMLAAITDREGRPLLPFYVLNRLDVALPLHLDIREVLRRELGERLVSIGVRRSAAVSEAMAQGMTAPDYAPDAPISTDYADLAAWLRSVSAASAERIAEAARGGRRGEG